MDRNGLIGRDNELPWRLPADLKLFKSITMGKPIIMGRKTFESIGRPLPGRSNIVITTNADYEAAGCMVAGSLDDAIEQAADAEEIMIIGGAALYEQALSIADRIYLTLVEAELQGDTWFPPLNTEEWRQAQCTSYDADDKNPFAYSFKILDRTR